MADFVQEIPDSVATFFTDFKLNVINDNKTRISGACKACKKRITGDWKPTRVTSNFVSHSKLCNPGKYSTYGAERNMKRKNPQQDLDGICSLTKHFCLSSQSILSDRVDDALIKFVVLDMLPLSLVEKEGFRFLMSVVQPSYHIPTRAKFTMQVYDQCRQVIKTIEKMTNDSQYCCAQADVWSSQHMHGYLGVSLSFIHNQKLETRLVSMKRFTGSHTAENISVIYQSVMKQFTSRSTVVGIVADNAANMVTASLKPVDVIDADEEEEGDKDEAGEELEHVPVDWEQLEEEGSSPVPVRYVCMAHTLQLVVHSGLAEASPKINSVLAKCDSFVSALHKSCQAMELLESEASIQIPSSNSTRWNSKLSMISAIVKMESKHEGTLQRVCDILPYRITLTPNDFAVLREMEQLLSPFEVATVHLQSEVVVTSSQILPTIVGLKKHIEKIELQHCTSVKSGLLASLSNRCDYLFRQAHCLIATAVDPRFKLRWTTDPGDSSAARQALLGEMQVVSQSYKYRLPAEEVAGAPVPQQRPSASQSDILFSYMMENSTPTNSSESELGSYLSSPCSSLEPLVYWSDIACQETFPTLYKLHLKHHCIPATSANVERVFSAAGYIASARRYRLSDTSLELLVIAKCNRDQLMNITI